MAKEISSQDYQHILETIEIAGEIPERSCMLKTIFEKIEQWFGIHSAAFFSLEQRTHQFLAEGALGHHASQETLCLFQSRFAPVHPVAMCKLHLTTMNQPVRITDVVSAARLPDTEYRCEFQSRVGIFYELCMTLACQGDLIACMGFHRTRREHDFSAREMTVMRYLLPHLASALHNSMLTETIVSGLDIGLVIMKTGGKVLLINEAAKRALQGRPVTIIPDPGLSVNPAYFHTERGTYRILSRMVFRGDRKVIFLNPVPSREYLHARLACFHLTARQEEIAILVIKGYANREIADRLFIAEQTVKDHLRDIFEKLEIHHRSELATMMLGFDTHRRARAP